MPAAAAAGGRANAGGSSPQGRRRTGPPSPPPGAVRINGMLMPVDMSDELKGLNVGIDEKTQEVDDAMP